MKKNIIISSVVVSCILLGLIIGVVSIIIGNRAVVLNVYNWGEYISDGEDGSYDTNRAFEEYCKKVLGKNVKVSYTTYSTNEDMYAKIKSDAGNYDVIFPSDYMVEKMIAEDLLYEFNTSENAEKLSNYGNIEQDFYNLPYDPGNRYSIPYTYGVIGIIYNTDLVSQEDVDKKSWGLLWDEKYAGKILQYNNPRDAFGTAMYYQNIDINSTDPDDWNRAFELLLKQKPLLQGYVSDEIYNKMGNGSAAVASYYVGDFLTMSADEGGDKLGFYYPKEGTNVFYDAMCIPKNAENKDLAMEYINFMLSEEAAVANAEYIAYASPNKLVKNSEEYKAYMQEEYGNEDFDAYELLYENSDIYRGEYDYNLIYKNPLPETQELMNELWEDIKTENAIEPWIHVATAGIVITIAVVAITYVVKRKVRIKRYCRYAESLKGIPVEQQKNQ